MFFTKSLVDYVKHNDGVLWKKQHVYHPHDVLFQSVYHSPFIQ